ncbi:MAG: hypothetical protein PHG30_10245 [Eubacteriales bacterium]|nr:hypothetical protein [Eubacteriales bacterium]
MTDQRMLMTHIETLQHPKCDAALEAALENIGLIAIQMSARFVLLFNVLPAIEPLLTSDNPRIVAKAAYALECIAAAGGSDDIVASGCLTVLRTHITDPSQRMATRRACAAAIGFIYANV